MLNRDFRDVLVELSAEDAEFIVVGAFAMAGHQFRRATGDLDIWVRPTAENARKVYRALVRFGAPLEALQLVEEDLARPGLVFQLGVAPGRLDFWTEIDGVTFEEAWDARVHREVEGVRIPILSLEHLLKNKRSTGRPKDLFDVAWIEEERRGD